MTEDHDLDTDLVALVHGELEPAQRRALRTRVDADGDLRARADVLEAADAALREALAAPGRWTAAPSRWFSPLLAAAALAVVATVFALTRTVDATAAQNDLLAVAVQPVGGVSHPVLTELAFDLQWTARGAQQAVRVLPLPPGAPVESLAAAFAALPAADREGVVPVAVRVALRTPDGEAWTGALDARSGPFVARGAMATQTVRSHDVGLETGAPAPYVFGRPTRDGWEHDFVWTFANAKKDAAARWFPDQPGAWTVEFHVHSVPPPEPGAWPAFAEPLVVATHVMLTGLRSEWGEEVDGMRARLVLATGCKGGAPFALQLRYTGAKPREYNVSGTTMAPIPQPLHFALQCRRGDREIPLAQRTDLAIVTGPDDLMRAHAPNSTRTIVASTDCWKVANQDWVEPAPNAKFALPGDRLAVEFVSQLTAWVGDGSQYWQGKVKTGSVVIP